MSFLILKIDFFVFTLFTRTPYYTYYYTHTHTSQLHLDTRTHKSHLTNTHHSLHSHPSPLTHTHLPLHTHPIRFHLTHTHTRTPTHTPRAAIMTATTRPQYVTYSTVRCFCKMTPIIILYDEAIKTTAILF